MTQTRPISRVVILFWTALLTAHATAAVAWWWLMPGGFPISSPRFWMNRVAPIAVVIVALAARFLIGRQRLGLLPLLLALGTMWMGIAIGMRVFFPVTFAWLWFAPVLLGIGIVAIARISIHQPLNAWVRLATALGITFGAWTALTQKALPPATHPANPVFEYRKDLPTEPRSVALSSSVRVDCPQGTVSIASPEQQLMIEPLLTFDSRSPDGCWVLFASRAARVGPARRLTGVEVSSDRVQAYYQSDFDQALWVGLSDKSSITIDSAAKLDRAIDSHLNTFAAMTLTGVRNPRISFSPCENEKIEITAGEYPFGKPHRFAYLGADGFIRVVEASSAEKGPFLELASGKLARGDVLTMVFYDGDKPLYSVDLRDWSTQLSTQLSPTAGWGVPENSIEFSRASENPKSAVSIFVTLANTSVGRGFDSVAHAPGVYQNRMVVKDLAAIEKSGL